MNRSRKMPLVAGITAAVVTCIAAPLVRKVMIRTNVMDTPNNRSSHTDPVPRGGGWACMVGTAAGLALARATGQRLPWKAILGAYSLGVVGFVDDRWNLPALPRLVAQSAVGGLCGDSRAASVVGAAVVPAVVNAVNFMDGVDSITALSVGVWGANASRSDSEQATLIGAVTAGAALGFLPHNLRRDKIFLGDVGSYFLGGMIALTAMGKEMRPFERYNLFLPLTIYAADTGFTLLVRSYRRQSVLEAHRDHTYQKLVDTVGLQHLHVAAIVSLAAALVTTLGRRGEWLAVTSVVAAYFTSPTWIARLSAHSETTGRARKTETGLAEEQRGCTRMDVDE